MTTEHIQDGVANLRRRGAGEYGRVENGARDGIADIAAERAIVNAQRRATGATRVEDGAAGVCRVAAEGAFAHQKRCTARNPAKIVEASATAGGRVAAHRAIDDGQARAAPFTVVVDAAARGALAGGRVAANDAVADCEGRAVVEDAATRVGREGARSTAVGNGQAGDGDDVA